jgi:hypothetical protein
LILKARGHLVPRRQFSGGHWNAVAPEIAIVFLPHGDTFCARMTRGFAFPAATDFTLVSFVCK